MAHAPTGEQALEQLATDPAGFALIVLDLRLPGAISGANLREHQLADAALRSIPTIVITATEPGPHERRRLQPDAWLEKPFRFDRLLVLIQHYVAPEWPTVGVAM